jgi:hypothetical protein
MIVMLGRDGCTQTTMAGMDALRTLAAARAATKEFDGSPAAIREARGKGETGWLRGFFTAHAEGSKIAFLFARQSFAAHLAAFSYLRFLFGVKLATPPGIEFFGDRLRSTMPGFFQLPDGGMPQLPITPTVREFLPRYVLKGTFTTTFLTMGEAMNRHSGKVATVLAALWPDEKWQDGVKKVLKRAEHMAGVISEEGDKTDDPFPSALNSTFDRYSGRCAQEHKIHVRLVMSM